MTDTEPLENNQQFRCGCSLKCHTLFTPEEISNHRLDCSDLTTAELDLVILAKLDALANTSAETSGNKKKDNVGGARQRSYSHFYHNGKKVCRQFFLFVNKIGKDRFDGLKKHYCANGLVIRKKRSGGVNQPRFPFSSRQAFFTFIKNYAEANAVSLPGRYPGFKDFKVNLLPSSTTRLIVYDAYKEAMQAADLQPFSFTTFRRHWQQLTPYILISKPASDLCFVCQQNNTFIMR